MQLNLITEEKTLPQEPTVSSLMTGSCFRRKKDNCTSFMYMVVNMSGGIRWENKTPGDIREALVINLKTGVVFSVYGNEEIIPCPNAAVLEDSVKQLGGKRGKS